MKKYKNRNEVPTKYKWDLEHVLGGKTPEELLASYEKAYKKLIEVKDSKYESKEAFLKGLKLEDEFYKIFYKLRNWSGNAVATNVVDAEANAFSQKVNFISYNLRNELGPEEPRVFANQAKIEKWLKEKEFAPYRSSFERIFETKKHQLPKDIQEFRTKESRADVEAYTPFAILTDAETDFGFAKTSKGKKIAVTRENRMELRKHKDAMVRKTASIAYRDGFLQRKDTLSNLLYQHFKHEATWSKLEKFNNVIDYLVFPDRSSEKLVLSLYKSVSSNTELRKQYSDIFSKSYKAKFGTKPTKYDMFVKLVDVKTEFSIEEQQKTIIKALSPFGKEYTDVVKRAFDERWVDYVATTGKRSGAYSIGGTYGVDKKYILMNNNGSANSMQTLAHELGHSLHSYFSDKHNHIREASYKIFVAEIASIFNELMLLDHMLKTSKDDKLKFEIRQQMHDGFEATVFRQTMFSNYEYDMYKAIEAGQPLSTYSQIAKVYFENSKKYSPNITKYDEKEQFTAIMIPHFYWGFYVYKYAIGQLVANIFFQRYKTHGPEALQDYISKFLAAGTKKTPLEVLKDNGIDLEDPKTYEEGFAPAYENVKELKTLAKKLFKF